MRVLKFICLLWVLGLAIAVAEVMSATQTGELKKQISSLWC